MQVSLGGFLWAESQVVSRFMSAVPGGGVGEIFTNLCLASGQLWEEQRAFFVSASSRLPSPEDEPSAKAADLGAAYPAVLHPQEHGLCAWSVWGLFWLGMEMLVREVEGGDWKQVQIGVDGRKFDQDGDKQWDRASFEIVLPFFC